MSKALRKDRDERYQAVQDLSFDLKCLQRQIEAGATQLRLPCSSCGHENPVGSAFCGKCGHTLQSLKPNYCHTHLDCRSVRRKQLRAGPV